MYKYILVIFLMPILFLCFMIAKGYIMYYRSGGKVAIKEKINFIKSSGGYTKYEDINPVILFVTLALEDDDFFLHNGINLQSIKKAAKANIQNKRIVMGGSTITQQLAKNLLFNFQKSYTRKIAEIFAVAVLENTYSKEEILEVYLNCIEYGNNNWSIKAACNYYFGKSPIDIELGQAVSLLSILPSPKYYNPISNKDKSYAARTYALDLLKRKKYIGTMEYKLIKESEFFEEDLFDLHVEKFYREIFRNSIRRAKESKTRLIVEINSLLTETILHGELSSEGLISYTEDCCMNIRTSYVWGGMMDLVDKNIIELLSKRYKDYYTDDKITQYKSQIGKEIYGCDCSGLIKSYFFGGLNHPLYEELYDINSSMMLYISDQKGEIDTLPEIEGICLYMPGHVGIYAGNGKVIESTENEGIGNGVVKSTFMDRRWTHWFHCPFVTY